MKIKHERVRMWLQSRNVVKIVQAQLSTNPNKKCGKGKKFNETLTSLILTVDVIRHYCWKTKKRKKTIKMNFLGN